MGQKDDLPRTAGSRRPRAGSDTAGGEVEITTGELFTQLFLNERLMWDIFNRLSLEVACAIVRRESLNVSDLIVDVMAEAETLQVDRDRLRELLLAYITEIAALARELVPCPGESSVAGRHRGTTTSTASRALKEFLREHHAFVENQLAAIPSSPEKAREALRALANLPFVDDSDLYESLVFLRDEIPSSLVTNVVSQWKLLTARHREAMATGLEPPSAIFWTSADFHETLDGIARYRFCEFFQVKDFPEVMEEVEEMAASALMKGYTGTETVVAPLIGDTFLRSVAFDLWLVSRSPRLQARVSPAIRMAVRRLVKWQAPEGYWPDFSSTDAIPSPFTTALAATSMHRLQVSQTSIEAALQATKWLLQIQNGDGSWSTPMGQEGRSDHPDLLTSILAAEALLRSGLPDVEHSVQLALAWIRGRQGPTGMWEDDAHGRVFPTVLVLELEDLAAGSQNIPLPYLLTAKEFLLHAMTLSEEDTLGARQLAIVAAAHAVEAFLYGALSRMTSDKKVFKKGNQTIGIREALDAFEKAISTQPPSLIRLELRNEIDRLVYVRDQVVHKALLVDSDECPILVEYARTFIERYVRSIFGCSLWDVQTFRGRSMSSS